MITCFVVSIIQASKTTGAEKKNQDVMNDFFCDHWSLLSCFVLPIHLLPKINAEKKTGQNTVSAAKRQHQDVMNTRPINPGEAERAGPAKCPGAFRATGHPKKWWWIGSGKYPHKCTKNSSFGIIGFLFKWIFPDFVNWLQFVEVGFLFQCFSFVRLFLSFVYMARFTFH